ncbi:MAG: MOP flippase family protein [Flavobacteriales bacterium]|nr:MOP flippase family protein [Flavobacteriales bacterium]
MSLKDQVKKGVKWTTISTVVVALSGILKISILTRFLEKSDFGLVAIITLILGFLNLFNDMGVTSAILHKQDISKKQYASLYWFNFGISILMYFIVLLVSPIIARFYSFPMLIILIPISGISLLFSGLGRQFKTIDQKELNFKRISIVELSSAVLSLVLAFMLAYNDYGIYSLIYSTLFQIGLSNVVFLFIGLKEKGMLFHYNYQETKPFLRIGMYQVGGQVANYFNRDLDILIIGKFFSAEVLGGYSLVKQLVFRPAMIINPILSKVAAPTLAKFQFNKEQLKGNYLKLVGIVSKVNFIIYTLMILFAPIILEIMYGEEYKELSFILRVLSIYMFLRSIANPVGSLVVATGRTDLEFKWNIIMLLLMPIFILVGAYFSVEMVASMVTLYMILSFVPFWKLIIYPLISVSLYDYVKSIFNLRFRI